MMQHFIPAPPAAVTRVLSAFNRQQLAAFVEVAIDLMDLADGDPDVEYDPLNEGEPAFAAVDRAHANRWGSDGPGCEIGDPDSAVDDRGCDDINDDREEVDERVPIYGIDQTKGIRDYERF